MEGMVGETLGSQGTVITGPIVRRERSKVQTRFPSGVGESLNPTMIFVQTTIENDLGHTFVFGSLGDQFADLLGSRLVPAVVPRTGHLRFER